MGLYTTFEHPADLLFRVFYPSSVGGLPANETTVAAALKPYGTASARARTRPAGVGEADDVGSVGNGLAPDRFAWPAPV